MSTKRPENGRICTGSNNARKFENALRFTLYFSDFVNRPLFLDASSHLYKRVWASGALGWGLWGVGLGPLGDNGWRLRAKVEYLRANMEHLMADTEHLMVDLKHLMANLEQLRVTVIKILSVPQS